MSVCRHLVAPSGDLSGQVGELGDVVTEAEERGLQRERVEAVEHLHGRARLRSIVEREGNPVVVAAAPDASLLRRRSGVCPLAEHEHTRQHVGENRGAAEAGSDASRRTVAHGLVAAPGAPSRPSM